MTYLMWELNPQLSVHEADTLQTELMKFFISTKPGSNQRPSELQSDDMLFQLSYWQNQQNTSVRT